MTEETRTVEPPADVTNEAPATEPGLDEISDAFNAPPEDGANGRAAVRDEPPASEAAEIAEATGEPPGAAAEPTPEAQAAAVEAPEADAQPTPEAQAAAVEAPEADAQPTPEAEPDGAEPATEDETEPEPAEVAAAAPEADEERAAQAEADASAEAAAATAATGPRTVGRYIADALRAAGVRYAFTVPGESFLGLLDGLADAGIRVIATRHEGGAAFMAEAHAQLTGRPAAALGTRAVGAANLAIGIHTARQNSTPMFALVGQVERAFKGREAFQEVDQVNSFGQLAKYAAEPTSAADIPDVMAEAIRQALGGRPGPVLLSLAEDLLDEEMADPPPLELTKPPTPRADVPEIRAVLQLLASAERPVILAGGGVLRARTSSDLTRFAELLHVPVVAAWRRGDVMSNDHPLFLGATGYGSPSVVRERLERADAMLVIGCRLNEIASFGYRIPADGVRWAHVDLAPREPGFGLRPPDIAVHSDARAFLRAANQRLRAAVLDAALVDARRANNEADRAAWEAASVVDSGEWNGPGIHPGKTITTLRRILPDEAIITIDAGNFGGWAARGFRFRRPGTFIGPTSGAMGYGLPAAIAAALVHRDRPVVALVGDGGLAMTMSELETAVREHVRLVVLVFDNERYGTIRMHQRRADRPAIATDLGRIDFAGVARAAGARGARIESDEAFEPALRQALAADRPTVLDMVLDRRWLSVDDPAAT